jgi:hypothetical protein
MTVALYDEQRRNQQYALYPAAVSRPPPRGAAAPVAHQKHCVRHQKWLVIQCPGPCLSDKIMRNDWSHVPLHIVVAEICEDESLNDFGEKHHWWPQTIAQSSQQTAAGIQNLQNRVIEAYVRWTNPEKNLDSAKHKLKLSSFQNLIYSHTT